MQLNTTPHKPELQSNFRLTNPGFSATIATNKSDDGKKDRLSPSQRAGGWCEPVCGLPVDNWSPSCLAEGIK